MMSRSRWFGGLVAAGTLLCSTHALAQSGRYGDDSDDSDDEVDYPPSEQYQQPPQQQPYYGDPTYNQNGYADNPYAQQPAPDFDATLNPYGEWVDVPGVGHVWRPYEQVVGPSFTPYATSGHWVYTDYGWSFESDWDWGWATFHYGRWFNRVGFGWLWEPGRVWAPAWVDWRFGGGYVGWAPMAPVGLAVYSYQPDWCFVNSAQFISPNVGLMVVPPAQVHAALAVTAPVGQHVVFNGVRFNAGPSPVHISAAVGQPIRPVSFTPPAPGHVAQVRIAPTGHAIISPPPRPQGGAMAAARPMGQANGWNRGPMAPPQTGRPMGMAQQPYRPMQPGYPAQRYPQQMPMPQRYPQQQPMMQRYPTPMQQPRYQAPQQMQPRYQAPSQMQPRYQQAPQLQNRYEPPRFSPPPARPQMQQPASMPHRNFEVQRSSPSPSFRAAAPSYHAPAPRFSAPTRSFSAPSFHAAPRAFGRHG